MAKQSLTFSAEGNGYGSNWFQPNGAFQLDIMFPESNKPNPVQLFAANDNSGAKPYALAGGINLKNTPHLCVPITKVIAGAGVYYKVTSKLNPKSASYSVGQ